MSYPCRVSRAGLLGSLIVTWMSVVVPVGAQQDQADVLEVVAQLFQGMRTADTALARSALADGARFALVEARDGAVEIAFIPVEMWLSAVARSERRWDELLYELEVRIDGNVASVWAPYTFYLDGSVSHCGTDSFQLLRGPAGWKVTQISDSRRTERCLDPRDQASAESPARLAVGPLDPPPRHGRSQIGGPRCGAIRQPS